MEISFPNEGIQHLFCCRDKLVQQFGPALARMICCRLSMLAAAPCLADVPASPPINLAVIDGKGAFTLALGPTHRLQLNAEMNAAQAAKLSEIAAVSIAGLISVPVAQGKSK